MEIESLGQQLTEERALGLAKAEIAEYYSLNRYEVITERVSDYSVDVVFTRNMGQKRRLS